MRASLNSDASAKKVTKTSSLSHDRDAADDVKDRFHNSVRSREERTPSNLIPSNPTTRRIAGTSVPCGEGSEFRKVKVSKLTTWALWSERGFAVFHRNGSSAPAKSYFEFFNT
ncbi:hypothetical protein BKA70DRAFT_1230984 [Coprinopsis sp. MPI-PUGE-AT-0042]|nr:hypothetical protein BKA70DRAFT_1230984 [Coprinopsis sp. MPI-PUGE-AT-0042]